MENEEGIERLFYDLASESRLSILRELLKQNLKMNEIARRLNLTGTEAFRQLQRLNEALLVQKNPEGLYFVTPYGRLLLQLGSSLEFVFKHKQYFLTHDISKLPFQFVHRIGELSQANLEMNVIANMNKIEQIVKEGEHYEWLLGEKALSHMAPVLAEKTAGGVKFRFLFPKKLLPPGSQAWIEHNIEGRGLPDIPAIVMLTEKEAIVCLPMMDGRLDYAGFSGKDKTFVNWAKELFLYFWEESKSMHTKAEP